MADKGKPTIGKGNNTFKQDYVLFLGGGFGGGGSPVPTVVTSYTYWIEHNPFAAFIRRMITENVSFEITSDAAGLNAVDLYVRFDDSNDAPDEKFTDPVEIAAGRSVFLPKAVLPPYYFITNTIKSITDPRAVADQGFYVYSAYQAGGINVSSTSFAYVGQSFVPTSPLLKEVFIKDVFRVGSTSDHTLYRDLIFELWDANRNFYANLGIVTKLYSANNTTDVNGNRITTLQDTFVTADDAIQYWTNILELGLTPKTPIKVVPGATYYIIARHLTPAASAMYAIGSNTDNFGNYNGKGRYIYGQAVVGNGTTITPVGTDIDLCFETIRTNQRTAVRFYWGNGGYYWLGDPSTFVGQFKLIKEDFDEVI